MRVGRGISEIDAELVHSWLHHDAYWCRGISWDRFVRAFESSVVISAWSGADQIGIARLVSDQATFAWLGDVYVDPANRKQGVARALVEAACALARGWGVRRVLLATADAHPLYERFGFRPVAPAMFMELDAGDVGDAHHPPEDP